MRLARSYLEGSDGTTELQEGWYLVDPKVSMQYYTSRYFLFLFFSAPYRRGMLVIGTGTPLATDLNPAVGTPAYCVVAGRAGCGPQGHEGCWLRDGVRDADGPAKPHIRGC